MAKLTLLKGLPGSGKSTWAKEQVKNSGGKIKRVNKDDLREMIDAGVWSKKNEQLILEIQWKLVHDWLYNDLDVIVDNTNFHKKHLKKAEEILEYLEKLCYNTEFILEVKFFDTPLEECIKRDAARPNSVGKNVIMKMYNQYLKPEPPKYNPNLKDCIICDLDGTLAIAQDGESWYDRDFSKDILNVLVKDMIRGMSSLIQTVRSESVDGEEYEIRPNIIFLSGRSDKNNAREQTIEFLGKNGFGIKDESISGYSLLMRQDGDNRPDEIVKRELYEQNILNKYNVKFIIDDRPKVVRMWRSLGLFVFDVNNRNEEF